MSFVRRRFILSVLTCAVAACSADSTTNVFAPLGLSLSLSPTVDTIFVADTITASNSVVLTVSATSLGRPVSTPAGVVWESSDPSVAVVSQSGVVSPIGLGTAIVKARVNENDGSATIVVANKAKQVLINPTALVGLAGDTTVVTASALDASNVLVPGTVYLFSSADPSVAAVTPAGPRMARVLFLRAGTVRITVTAAGQTASATATIQPREFVSAAVTGAPAGALALSAGEDATCGLLPLGRAYCFGRAGLLGVAKDTTCFNDVVGRPTEACTLVPLRIAGQLNLVSVSVGDSVACAATSDNRAYCWGSQKYGQLGNGIATSGTSVAPALVIGAVSRAAVSLARVSAGGNHACGLNPAGAAFCWGQDSVFQLGNGDGLVVNSTTPVPVAGSNVFSSISAGGKHTCALTSSGTALCWGDNSRGQLGAGLSDAASDAPIAVSGTTLSSISSGGQHTCGLTAAGAALCWGDNSFGQLGSGVPNVLQSNTPVAVAGGLQFKSISAGRTTTCGVTTGGAAFCWGNNAYWQLGMTNVANSNTPVPVGGGHTDFTAVTAGVRHSCASSAVGAFCWGSNVLGALGNELQAIRQATPTKTAVPQ